MEKTDYEEIIHVLEPFVSEHKQELVNKILADRTKHIALVFEDIDKPHNISAVLRTAECLGIQDLHFIKNKNDYSVNPTITQGAAKWLSLHHHNESENNVDVCFGELRSNGFKIYATSLHETSQSIYDIDPSEKTAIVFGTEADGITKETGQKADGYVHIPMNGFTESFNLSVSAAICLTVLRNKMEWPEMNQQEKEILKSEWYRKIVREADKILKVKGINIVS